MGECERLYARKIKRYDVTSGLWRIIGIRIWNSTETDYVLGEGDIVLVNEQRVMWNTSTVHPYRLQRYIGKIRSFSMLANNECEIKLEPLVFPNNNPNPYNTSSKLPYYSAINTHFLEYGFYKFQKLQGFNPKNHRCFKYGEMTIESRTLARYYEHVAGEIFKNAYEKYPKGEGIDD